MELFGYTKQKKSKIDEYIESGKGWENDNNKIIKSELRNKRVMNLILSIGMIMTSLSAAYMAVNEERPLIQIEEVDRVTGYRALKTLVKVGEPLTEELKTTYLKSDIRRFIDCYEGYTFAKKNTNLECVAAFSNEAVAQQYMRYVDEKNPASPTKVIGSKGMVNVKVIDINPLTADKFTIVSHLILQPEMAGRHELPTIPLTVTITYKYVNIPMDANTRELNPHGIVITSYQQSFKH